MAESNKLCGFLRILLSLPSSTQTLSPLTPCSLFKDNSTVGFRSDTGISLFPLEHSRESDNSTQESSKKRRNRWPERRNSAIHQLHALVSHKCVEIEAKVTRVLTRGFGENEETRVVVLVDIYLPILVWSGWQFPRSRAVAASLFKHVSCDWELRNSLLAFDWTADNSHTDDHKIWADSNCHVLTCDMHQNFEQSSNNKKSFDLHEIFKSLPGVGKEKSISPTRIKRENPNLIPGIWDISDDVLNNILTLLGPKDLVWIAATCHHLRSLAASIIPCIKLKLFPHQEAAVEWMLNREINPKILPHPLFKEFCTEDGFAFYLNTVSGEISLGVAPSVTDFRGGMFCDEPGLGKTVTALSLILKTHGTLAEPPNGVEITWCMHGPGAKCGYYELSADNSSKTTNFTSPGKRFMSSNESIDSIPSVSSYTKHVVRCSKSLNRVKRNLLERYDDDLDYQIEKRKKRAKVEPTNSNKRKGTPAESSETWVQCDACRKWRKLSDKKVLDATSAWFCSMNSDPTRQSCASPEETWDSKGKITYLPGFYTKGTEQGKQQNVSFFISVLKENFTLFNSETRKALDWLANLSHQKLLEMETVGLTRPVLDARSVLSGKDVNGYHRIFQSFGLVRKTMKGTSRWYYPSMLENLEFDVTALQIALTKPLDLLRFYLSGATLIVVPTNLVDHWRTQIDKHVSPGQLRVYFWGDHKKKPSAHNLAWDYDIVISTFSRLSAEWGPRKRSVLSQIHWLRVILDEGHTLGSSLNLTNKLQMAVSLAASSRWILTGTPTPNTPNTQIAHLHPMLKFLHEQAYGQSQDSWEGGIQKPFEANSKEGYFRLFDLLQRTMISARKSDLKNIPPCIRKLVFLHFNQEHAKSYNELVAAVRRNILMADWKDPSHVESLLNPKQWKFRGNTIRNVRLSCCVAGHIKMRDAGWDIQETMDILVQNGLDPVSEEYAFIRVALLDGCSCFRCKDWCRLPIVTPCRHLLCLDCVALDSERCTLPGCGFHYEMQSPETLARPENPNPKWPVPKDLIELQPSYEQNNWDPDWQSTSSSKVAYMIDRLRELRESSRKNGYYINYETNINCSENGAMLDAKDCNILPEKVIIFSQFLEHIHVIEQQLSIAGIPFAGMYSPMHSSNKMKSLITFQQDPNCMALLMDGSAALGLDLSFVTHVFLMEPIWDRSMEEQVISRAHRMGATRPIYVETLAMHGTLEEQMMEFLQDHNTRRRVVKEELNKGDNGGARTQRTLHDFAQSNYLAQLCFIRTRTI